MPGNHERSTSQLQPERGASNEAFNGTIGKEKWSPEARILNASTPVESDAFNGVPTSETKAERDAFDTKLREVITQVNGTEQAGAGELGGRGMAILSEMTDVAVDTSHGRELGTLRHEHYDAPQGYEAKWITKEFPNPAALVERYGQLMELRKRQHPKGEFDVESKKADMERIAAVIYGERWDVYQETLREAEAAKANATPPSETQTRPAAEAATSRVSATEATPPVPAEAGPTAAEAPPKSRERIEHEVQAHEVLNKFQMYRTDVRENAANFMTNVQRTVAHTKNLLSSPKNFYLQLRRDRMQRKYDRISAKQDASRFNFINRRRDRKARKMYGKLQKREAALNGHNAMMRGRVEKVNKKGDERLSAVAERRKELMEKKIAAEERRVLRRARRDRRMELMRTGKKVSHAERERMIEKSFTPEDKKRIRQMAIAAVRRETKNKGIEQ